MKRINAQDATLRNVRAAHTRIHVLTRMLARVEKRVCRMEAKYLRLWNRR